MKLKDGYKKLIGTSYNGDISQVLLSNGGNLGYAISSTASTLVQRNANGQIESSLTDKAPFKISSTILNTNLNAELLEGYYVNQLFEDLSNDSNQISITIGGTNKKITIDYSQHSSNLVGGDSGNIIYQSSANTTAFLASPEYDFVLRYDTENGKPYWGIDSDTKVTQTITTTDANYRVLFSATADDTTRTETTGKASNLLFNPSYGLLTAGGFIKEGYDDTYVLLAGGGQKALSEFGGTLGDYIIYNNHIDSTTTTSAYKEMGYGYMDEGWLTTGPAISIGASNGYIMQLQQQADANNLFMRYGNSSYFGDWVTLLHSGNYTNYIPFKQWTAVTTVNSWSRIMTLEYNTNVLLTINFSQNSQSSSHLYLVSTGYNKARIVQLGANNYLANYAPQVRVTTSSETILNVEVYNTYGYNGATTVPFKCQAIVLGNGNITPISTYTAGGGTVASSLTSHCQIAANFYASRAAAADTLISHDTRSNTINPNSYSAGFRAHFQQNGTNGINDGGVYYGLINFKPYGGTADFSGGYPHQLAFTENSNIYYRKATSSTAWGSWVRLLTSSNYTSYTDSRYYRKYVGGILSSNIDTFDSEYVCGGYSVTYSGYSGMLLSFKSGQGSVSSIEIMAPHYDLAIYGLKARLAVDNNRYTAWRTFAFTDSTVTGANQVKVHQHNTNNVEYPLIWSNQNNTNSVLSDIFKSYSDLVYNPANKRLTAGRLNAAQIGISTIAGTGDGISLHNGPTNVSLYGIAFVKTANWGTHGAVAGDWATYFTVSKNGTNQRGWIFRSDSSNVASIDVYGRLTVAAGAYAGNYGINMANSDIVGINALFTADLANDGTEGLQFKRTNGNYDSIWAADGTLYFSPNGNNASRNGSYSTNYTIWHSGNDGSGSGLDADLLDGKHLNDLNVDYIYTINCTSLSTSNFYPVVFSSNDRPLHCKIQSDSRSNSHAYNQNILEFSFVARGWSDTPKKLTIINYGCYSNSEITIGCIGNGNEEGITCVWVRGGSNYRIWSNRVGSLKTSDYTSGNEIFTVGTGYSGGTNTKVTIYFTPQSTISSGMYVNDLIKSSSNIFAAHFYENSDIMLKTNIKPISESDNIPVLKSFDWKYDGTHGYGLIAQELEAMGYPELVSGENDGNKTVNYSAALSLIVGKLQVKIKELEKEIEILKNKN